MCLKYQNLYISIISIIFLALLVLINSAQAETSNIKENALIFTEIMYNPEGSDQDKEWVEIFNTSTTTININSEWRFSDGQKHLLQIYQGNDEIEKNKFFIIAKNAQKFLEIYPNFDKTIFESSFNLNNSSNTIQIFQGDNLINEFTYNSNIGADGNGKTLEKINPLIIESSWQESYVVNGSPGDYSSHPPTNQAPIADAGNDLEALINESLIFDASNSYDPDNDELTFLWDFANLANSSSKIATYTFNNAGTYSISLEVSDGQASSTDTLIATINETSIINEKPIIIIDDLNEKYDINDLINFNACNSYDPENKILTFNWSFGDNGHANGCQINYRYSQNGNYNVNLLVSDGQNEETWQKTLNIINSEENKQIIINELLPNPQGSDEAEWIELKNLNKHPINLKNWYIEDASENKYIFKNEDFSNLNIDKYFVLERNISNISLNNSNETIKLFDNLGQKIDEMAYEDSKENYSWARFDNEWEMTPLLTKANKNQKENIQKPKSVIDLLSTKLIINQNIILSAENSQDLNGQELKYKWFYNGNIQSDQKKLEISFSDIGLKKIRLEVSNESNLKDESYIYLQINNSSEKENQNCSNFQQKIIINEIMVDPQGSDNQEWIELYNPYEKNIDLNNWLITDHTTEFKLHNIIKAHNFLLIKKENSKINLNNSNENIELFDCQNNSIWNLSYEKSFEGQSYAYNEISKKYFWTQNPSPLMKNIFSSPVLKKREEDSKTNKIINFVEIEEIKNLEKNQEILSSGIVVALNNELRKNTTYICYYNISDNFYDLNECLALYLNKKWPFINYGDLIQVKGKIEHLKNYSRIKIKDPKDILIIKKNIKFKIEEYAIEEISEELNNSLISVSGQISKKNKRSFYIKNNEEELKIKINNQKIKIDKLNKNDFVNIKGLIIVKDGKINLNPRRQKDLTKSQILGIKKTKEEKIIQKPETINFKKNTNKTNFWFLGFSIIGSLFFIFKNKLWQIFKK